MSRLVKVTNITIKVCNLDDLNLVLKKVDALNEEAEFDVNSNYINANIEVDLNEKQPVQDEIPPIYKMRLALSEVLQNAANGLRFVPEDSCNEKHYDHLESGGKYTDRPEQENISHSECTCKYAVYADDKSIPRPTN